MAGTRASMLADQPAMCPVLDQDLYRTLGWGREPTSRQAQEFIEHCALHPANFIFSGALRTFDEHAAEHESPHKIFPDKEYLRRTLSHMHDGDMAQNVRAISKSRQLMVSWLACAYAIWTARFKPHRRVMMQSRKAEAAYALVYWKHWQSSRCSFMELALPPFMRIMDGRRGALGTKGEINYPHGSVIMGIPEGGHQFRSYVASLVIMDEVCFMPEFRDSYKAALAMAKGGGRIVVITTAQNGSYYAELVEEADDQDTVEAA